MSEFHVIEISLNDQQALVDALVELGYTPTVYKEAKNLYGYQGDKRSQKAHVIIPRRQVGSVSNDVGFERKSDGSFIMHLSEYDERSKTFNVKKMKQLYAKNRITKALKKKSKYRLSNQKVEKDGRIVMRVRVG